MIPLLWIPSWLDCLFQPAIVRWRSNSRARWRFAGTGRFHRHRREFQHFQDSRFDCSIDSSTLKRIDAVFLMNSVFSLFDIRMETYYFTHFYMFVSFDLYGGLQRAFFKSLFWIFRLTACDPFNRNDAMSENMNFFYLFRSHGRHERSLRPALQRAHEPHNRLEPDNHRQQHFRLPLSRNHRPRLLRHGPPRVLVDSPEGWNPFSNKSIKLQTNREWHHPGYNSVSPQLVIILAINSCSTY